jgi:hypothetical protein
MKRDEIHHNLLEILANKIRDKTVLIETLKDILFMEKGAVVRRLRGEVPFSFFEVVTIADKLDISLTSILYAESPRICRFEQNIIEYAQITEVDYKKWDDYLAFIGSIKNDSRSDLAESSNVLPISIYAGFDALSRFFLFKYQYLFSDAENRKPFGEVFFPERLSQIFRSYFSLSRDFAKTIYILDYMAIRYLASDISFFSGINLLSGQDVQQIKADLHALIDYIEKITLNGCYEETGNEVKFYISDINLDADYSCLRCNDMYVSLIRTFILNSIVSTDKFSYLMIKDWIQSLKKSSTLISQSGAIYRADFFEKQRSIISEL